MLGHVITRGSTPYMLLAIKEYDLTKAEVIVVSIKGKTGQLDIPTERIIARIIDGVCVLIIHMTQEETLSIYPSDANIQVRWRNPDGESYITEILKVCVADCLYKEVI